MTKNRVSWVEGTKTFFYSDEFPVIKRFRMDGDTEILSAEAVVGFTLELHSKQSEHVKTVV